MAHFKGNMGHDATSDVCVVVLLELFSGVDVKWTLSRVEMVEDLDGDHVAVGSVDVLELAVPVFV